MGKNGFIGNIISHVQPKHTNWILKEQTNKPNIAYDHDYVINVKSQDLLAALPQACTLQILKQAC